MVHRTYFAPIRSIVIIFTLMAVLGCSFMQGLLPGNPDQAAPSQPDTASPGEASPSDNREGEEQTKVRMMDESYEPVRYDFPALGSVSFQKDTDASTSLEVTVHQPAIEMQVVDAAGLTWKLSIPEGALESDQTLTMTPLSDLHSSQINSLAGGVVLEPDGLKFMLPAHLSVSGLGLGEYTLILSGTHMGEAVDYALHDLSAPEPTAQLLHFSTYFASHSDDAKINEIYKQAYEAYQQAVKDAKKLLKGEIQAPGPPSIPLECPDAETGEENGQELDKFLKDGMEPENALLVRLLTLRSVMARAGMDEFEAVGEVELRLINRQYRKAQELIGRYQGDEEKLLAVSLFVVEVARQLQLLGDTSEKSALLINDLASWTDKMVDTLLKDIAKDHNYKKIPVVLVVARKAQLLGAENRTEIILEALQNALKFEVQINFALDLPDESWVTDSKVQVRFEGNSLTTCQGGGKGVYTSATSPNAVITAPSYPIQVVIKDFDPCEGTVTIGFDRFGAASETYTIDPDDDPLVAEMPLVQNSGEVLYADNAEGGIYWFTMEVENGNPVAAEESFEQSKYGKVDGNLTVKLVHTPE